MITANVLLFVEDKNREIEGKKLSEKFEIPLASHFYQDQIMLALTKERLELRLPLKNTKPIYVDFFDKNIQLRLQKSQGRSELIARAVGIKGSCFPSVIDTTAGLGVDAVVLAHLGCTVQMIERSPVICALLEDGLKRAQSQKLAWLSRLTLTCIDAKIFLQTQIDHEHFVDVIYLDPMFPERIKSALVKKEMQVLKKIVGSDEDATQLFAIAKKCAQKRVVVKRPRYAVTLTRDIPAVVYTAKASRFDVYFSKNAHMNTDILTAD